MRRDPSGVLRNGFIKSPLPLGLPPAEGEFEFWFIPVRPIEAWIFEEDSVARLHGKPVSHPKEVGGLGLVRGLAPAIAKEFGGEEILGLIPRPFVIGLGQQAGEILILSYGKFIGEAVPKLGLFQFPRLRRGLKRKGMEGEMPIHGPAFQVNAHRPSPALMGMEPEPSAGFPARPIRDECFVHIAVDMAGDLSGPDEAHQSFPQIRSKTMKPITTTRIRLIISSAPMLCISESPFWPPSQPESQPAHCIARFSGRGRGMAKPRPRVRDGCRVNNPPLPR